MALLHPATTMVIGGLPTTTGILRLPPFLGVLSLLWQGAGYPMQRWGNGREIGLGNVYREWRARLTGKDSRCESVGEAGVLQHHGQCPPPALPPKSMEIPAGAGSIELRHLGWVQHRVTCLVTRHCNF